MGVDCKALKYEIKKTKNNRRDNGRLFGKLFGADLVFRSFLFGIMPFRYNLILFYNSDFYFASFSKIFLRNAPVKLLPFSATCSGVPVATISPPPVPPSGPKSII